MILSFDNDNNVYVFVLFNIIVYRKTSIKSRVPKIAGSLINTGVLRPMS